MGFSPNLRPTTRAQNEIQLKFYSGPEWWTLTIDLPDRTVDSEEGYSNSSLKLCLYGRHVQAVEATSALLECNGTFVFICVHPSELIRFGRKWDAFRFGASQVNPGSRQALFQDPHSDLKLLNSTTSQRGMSTSTASHLPYGRSTDKIFAPYSVYKGKAALSADPLLPTFSKLESGGLKVDRRGVIMLTLWPAIGERKYDWDKRQKFALSATEVGSLISLGSKDSCEFFHDPSMLSSCLILSNAGQVRKSLSIKAHADGSGYFISLTVANNVLKTNDRLGVPVTTAEFAVMRTAFTFALPHIMGWDKYTNQRPQSANLSSPKALPEFIESEWDR
ncbi:hypothetical protein F511_01211 [Dorcoceras hygrometricum]|uniref:Single-stranded DNA-bindig protein WHY2, mitochondrial n=1 Tax=Dorcoceras hygrometricum TaxID=472368 RepID=A0A2Z7BRX6_9LAMI|nr:hypothetical protein F511_01211 [Dorcoceras hygrometricum]